MRLAKKLLKDLWLPTRNFGGGYPCCCEETSSSSSSTTSETSSQTSLSSLSSASYPGFDCGMCSPGTAPSFIWAITQNDIWNSSHTGIVVPAGTYKILLSFTNVTIPCCIYHFLLNGYVLDMFIGRKQCGTGNPADTDFGYGAEDNGTLGLDFFQVMPIGTDCSSFDISFTITADVSYEERTWRIIT